MKTKNALEKIKNEEEQLLETKNALEIKKITTKRILKERELATNDLKIDDLSKTTLEKIKEGDLGIRNDYLIECWAKRRKPDFEEMSQQRIELLDWLEKLDLLDAPQDQDDSIRGDINFQKHLARRKPFPAHRHFDQPMKHKWPDGLSDEVWWVLAKITHVIEFEDKKTFYLFDVDLREKLRHSELKELETLEKARTSTSNLVDDQYGTDMVLPEKVMPEFAALPKTLQRAFNFLIKPNPKKAGFALSLKTVGGELGCSSQTVLRYRREIGSRSKALGNIIAVERAKNDRKVSTRSISPTSFSRQ